MGSLRISAWFRYNGHFLAAFSAIIGCIQSWHQYLGHAICLFLVQYFNIWMSHTLIFISLLLMLTTCSHRLTKFSLTPQKRLLILYSEPHATPTQINFKIDFNSTEFIIDKDYMENVLYLDSKLKYKINGAHVQAKKLSKNINENEDE